MLLALILILPITPLIFWSFANRWQFPHALPQVFGFNGWFSFFTNGGVAAVGQSLLIGFLTMVLVVPLSFGAAHVVTNSKRWYIRIFEGILFLPVFLPPFVLVMGVATGSIIVGASPLLTVIGTISALAMPYSLFVLRSAFINYGKSWEEEGKLLGARGWVILLRIRIRMLKKPILAASLIAFLIGWSDYIVTLTVGGGQVLSLPLLIGSAASAPGNDSTLATMSLISIFLPVMLAKAVQLAVNKKGM